MKHVHSAT